MEARLSYDGGRLPEHSILSSRKVTSTDDMLPKRRQVRPHFEGDDESDGPLEKLDTRWGKFRALCCNPRSRRYAWRPVLRHRLPLWLLTAMALFYVTTSAAFFILAHSDVECRVEYPSAVLTDVDRARWNASLNVTLGEDETCDATGCYRNDQVIVPPEACSGTGRSRILLTTFDLPEGRVDDTHAASADVALENVTHRLEGEAQLYLELAPYYQNHRKYVASYSREQREASQWGRGRDLQQCEPVVNLQDLIERLGTDEIKRRGMPDLEIWPLESPDDLKRVILYPCGLQAITIPTDEFFLTDLGGTVSWNDPITWTRQIELAKGVGKEVEPEELETASGKKFPAVYRTLNQALFPGDVSDPSFMNWIRLSPTSHVRKLVGRRSEGQLIFPLEFTVRNRYSTLAGDTEKFIVIRVGGSTGTWPMFTCLISAALGIVLGLSVLIFMVKLRVRPRLMGDLKLLHQRAS